MLGCPLRGGSAQSLFGEGRPGTGGPPLPRAGSSPAAVAAVAAVAGPGRGWTMGLPAPAFNPGLLLLPCGEAPERHGPSPPPSAPSPFLPQPCPAPGDPPCPEHPLGAGSGVEVAAPPAPRLGSPRPAVAGGKCFTPSIPALTFAGACISQSGISVWEPFPETVNMPEELMEALDFSRMCF